MRRLSYAMILNSNQLGGAERSFILQASRIRNADVVFYIPEIAGVSHHLISFINLNCPQARIIHFYMNKNYYNLSRSQNFSSISSLLAIFGLILTWLRWSFQFNIEHHDFVWANGNKVALSTSLYLSLRSYRGLFIWHHRDYPSSYLNRVFSYLSSRRLSIEHLCNSQSVQSALEKLIAGNNQSSRIVYNPSGLETVSVLTRENRNNLTVGVMSMLAPWKGIHTVILFGLLYEEELVQQCNLKQIKIFGDQIYKTDGKFVDYTDEIKKLANRSRYNIFQFEGVVHPSDALNSIDVLIHSSLSPEPFGRVVLEAFKAKVPVISTALGGTSELIESGKTGFVVKPFDYASLFKTIKDIKTIDTKNVVKQAYLKSLEIERQSNESLDHFIMDIEHPYLSQSEDEAHKYG